MKERRYRLLFVTLAVAGLLLIPTGSYVIQPTDVAPSVAGLSALQSGFMSHINHIVFVVMENHAYDSIFGAYCLAKSSVCPYPANGIPGGTCVPENPANLTGACIRPWNFTRAEWSVPDMWHNMNGSLAAWNNGSMNGFYLNENLSCKSCGDNDSFGHYNGSTDPLYWGLAQEYTLSDAFYSSVMSYSLPNHWHIVAGQAPPKSVTYNALGFTLGQNYGTKIVNTMIKADHTLLNQSNDTRSIEDVLLKSNVSWDYYQGGLANYSSAIQIITGDNGSSITQIGPAFAQFNPQAAKAESYNASFAPHFVANTRFFTDARSGNLPNLSWVMPPGQYSDHPPDNATLAQEWLASVVDAVESSPEWNSTALFVTWDDYGGFYDHVDPPVMNGQQLGFRVPLLIVSPYTSRGFVSAQPGYFESVLRLMEWRFHLGCITTLDCRAPLPLWGFNFARTPRAPMLFPTNFNQSTYPFNPKWNTTGGVEVGGYYPPEAFTYFPDGEAADDD